jgi:hypothetical protein
MIQQMMRFDQKETLLALSPLLPRQHAHLLTLKRKETTLQGVVAKVNLDHAVVRSTLPPLQVASPQLNRVLHQFLPQLECVGEQSDSAVLKQVLEVP